MKRIKNESIVKLISALEEKYKDSSEFVLISSITNSPDEVEYILNNTDLFFAASKSRIILTHWLCEEVRQIYEQVNYDSIDLANEAYEKLRKHFHTKAFNKAEFLKIFNSEKKTILSYEEFLKIEQRIVNTYNNIVPNDMKLSTINHIYVTKKDEQIDLIKEFEEFLPKQRQEEILYERACGVTLDVIGEKFEITRERARQIEIKPKALIERWMDSRHKEIINAVNGNILLIPEKAVEFFGERKWTILKYAAKNNKNKFSDWHYIKELDTICYGSELYNTIFKELEKASKTNKSVSDVTNDIKEKYSFFTEKILREFCSNSNFHIYDEKIYDGKLNIGESIIIAAENKYSDGIDIGNKETLTDFADYLNKTFKLNVKPDRALTARIQDLLIMSDNTVYKSQKFINSTKELDDLIKNYINSLEDDRTTYQQMYDNLPKDILKKNGINTYSGLHGYIKKHEDNLGIISLRYYVCKKETKELLSSGFFIKLTNWLKEKNRPVPLDEILQEFDGWTEMYPKYAMLYFPQIVQWEKNVYLNLDIINTSKEFINIAKNTIKESIDNDLKYTNIYIIYKKLSPVLEKYFTDITLDENKLYHILKYHLNDDFVFTKPHIVSKELNVKEFTTEDLINSIIGNGHSVLKSDISDGINKYYGEKNSSLALALQKVLKDFIRIEPNKYFRKSKIKLSKKNISEIENFVEKHLVNDKYLVAEKLSDFSELPKTNFKWTSWGLCEIIRLYSNKFDVLSKRNNIMVNTMVIVKKDEFKTKESLLTYILNNEYKGNHSEEAVAKFVKDLGMFSNSSAIKDVKEEINFEIY